MSATAAVDIRIDDLPDLLGTAPADLIDRATNLPVAERDVAVRRAERIRAGLVSYTQMRQDIADAYACRDWQALGHATWFEYVEQEFGDELRKLSRGERREAARDLREQGMSVRQIAQATGASVGTVHGDTAGVQPLNTSESGGATVTGSDGKTYPAAKPAPKPAAERPEPRPTEPEPPKPAESMRPEDRPGYWSPEERKAHEEEVQVRRDRESARTYASNFVLQVRTYVVTIVTGYRLGEHDLVTLDDIAAARKSLDLLEKEVLADAQR